MQGEGFVEWGMLMLFFFCSFVKVFEICEEEKEKEKEKKEKKI